VFSGWYSFPSIWYSFDNLRLLMPREAQVHKPLAVKLFGHFFQNGDAAGIVFDQVVVGGKDGGYFALDGERGDFKFNRSDFVETKGLLNNK